MNKTLKWVLIGLGIAVAAFIVAMVVFGVHRTGFSMMGGRGFNRIGGRMGGLPMMGFMPMIGFRLLRGLFGLVILALAVFGVIFLVRNNKAKSTNQVANMATPVETTPVVEPEKLCKNCGKPVNSDWMACPYCGKKQ